MDVLGLRNLLAYGAQLTALVMGAGALLALLRVRAPGLRYGFWRALLALCLLLPWLQTPLPERAVASNAGATALVTLE
ncbi:MAG: hypothetical protein ACRD1H_18750, partial [Vicinamibacterales bacterium]